jgi:hypothetical protein
MAAMAALLDSLANRWRSSSLITLAIVCMRGTANLGASADVTEKVLGRRGVM